MCVRNSSPQARSIDLDLPGSQAAPQIEGKMTKLKLVITIIVAATAAACVTATPKVLVPFGGSRADGTVELAFEFRASEVPVVDYAAGQVSATQRCQAWGYTNAEAFGGAQRQCMARYEELGCVAFRTTVSYQCTGAKPPN